MITEHGNSCFIKGYQKFIFQILEKKGLLKKSETIFELIIVIIVSSA